MKKTFVYALTIIALVAMVFGTVTPAFAAEAQTATFTGFQYVYGKGAVFNFDVTGTFSSAELHGTLTTSDGTVRPLYCVQMQDDATRVNCNTSRNIYGTVTVAFAGFSFTVQTSMDTCALYRLIYQDQYSNDVIVWWAAPGDVSWIENWMATYYPTFVQTDDSCIEGSAPPSLSGIGVIIY
jgi:hypothetical protein